MSENDNLIDIHYKSPAGHFQKLETLRNQLGMEHDAFYTRVTELGGACMEAELVHGMAAVLIHTDIDGIVSLQEYIDGDELYMDTGFSNERNVSLEK